MVIMLPVDSSAPANTTAVRAIPNTSPWTTLVQGEFAALSGPVADSSRTTATPMNAPASIELTR